MYGLLNETSLKEDYHVLSINTTPYHSSDSESEYLKKCHEFSISNEVVQACVTELDSLFTPAKALRFVNKICQKQSALIKKCDIEIPPKKRCNIGVH